jgi:hypothetical protein
MKRQTFEIKETECPFCFYRPDHAMQGTVPRPPKAGDMMLCANCGEICVFDEKGNLDPASEDQLERVPETTLRILVQTRMVIKCVKDAKRAQIGWLNLPASGGGK